MKTCGLCLLAVCNEAQMKQYLLEATKQNICKRTLLGFFFQSVYFSEYLFFMSTVLYCWDSFTTVRSMMWFAKHANGDYLSTDIPCAFGIEIEFREVETFGTTNLWIKYIGLSLFFWLFFRSYFLQEMFYTLILQPSFFPPFPSPLSSFSLICREGINLMHFPNCQKESVKVSRCSVSDHISAAAALLHCGLWLSPWQSVTSWWTSSTGSS